MPSPRTRMGNGFCPKKSKIFLRYVIRLGQTGCYYTHTWTTKVNILDAARAHPGTGQASSAMRNREHVSAPAQMPTAAHNDHLEQRRQAADEGWIAGANTAKRNATSNVHHKDLRKTAGRRHAARRHAGNSIVRTMLAGNVKARFKGVCRSSSQGLSSSSFSSSSYVAALRGARARMRKTRDRPKRKASKHRAQLPHWKRDVSS